MSGALLRNLVLFGRVLRRLGMDVDPGRIADLVAAAEAVSIRNRSDFQAAARSLLVHRREDLARFDDAFDAFFTRRDPLARPSVRSAAVPAAGPQASRLRPGADDATSPALSYSDREVLRRKDFAEMTPAELRDVQTLIAELVWRMSERKTRRLRPGRGALLDLRRTVRRNLRYGGELLDRAHREPKRKPRSIVIIADVSGSMERYSRLLLLFTYGIGKALEQKVEAFVFSTRLTRITLQLRQRALDRALHEVARTVSDWSGGTRIGEALRTFNRRWRGRGAVVLLISDGWDRGDPSLLRREIAHLRRTSHRLIWLNPLLGAPDYEPLTRGIQTALPFIDDFLPIHNLDSLTALAAHLGRVGEARR